MIFNLHETKSKINNVHVGALRDSISHTKHHGNTVINHIPGMNNVADALTRVTNPKLILSRINPHKPNQTNNG